MIQQSDSRYSPVAMEFKLDYDKMLFLDAEDLAEAGIKEAYQSMMRALGQYVSEPAEVQTRQKGKRKDRQVFSPIWSELVACAAYCVNYV